MINMKTLHHTAARQCNPMLPGILMTKQQEFIDNNLSQYDVFMNINCYGEGDSKLFILIVSQIDNYISLKMYSGFHVIFQNPITSNLEHRYVEFVNSSSKYLYSKMTALPYHHPLLLIRFPKPLKDNQLRAFLKQ